MAQPNNILLSGFPDEECKDFINQGFDVSVWIRAPHKKSSPSYDAGLVTYLHSEVRAFDFAVIKDVQLPTFYMPETNVSEHSKPLLDLPRIQCRFH